MRIVTNASPLIFLSKIDSLGLLQQCFSGVLVPPAVAAETGLELPDFVEQSQLSDLGEAFVRGALGNLHQGELETLVLARERGTDLVAVDDGAARRKAAQMGLRPIGTVGILVLARRFGHLDEPSAHGAGLLGVVLQEKRGWRAKAGQVLETSIP